MKDYGRRGAMRVPLQCDQIYIGSTAEFVACNKTKFVKIDEDETAEFIGIINYSIMALVQIDLEL
jgi:hypothetical protein